MASSACVSTVSEYVWLNATSLCNNAKQRKTGANADQAGQKRLNIGSGFGCLKIVKKGPLDSVFFFRINGLLLQENDSMTKRIPLSAPYLHIAPSKQCAITKK
jgi:hypothetical protein